jgi:hypothetical protein
MLELKRTPLAQTVIRLMHCGISAKNVSTWSAVREKLFAARANGFGHLRSLVLVSRVQFGPQEDQLYMEFHINRQLEGLPTADQWIKDTMDQILFEDKPPNWNLFRASAGWVTGFKKRYRISKIHSHFRKTSLDQKVSSLLGRFANESGSSSVVTMHQVRSLSRTPSLSHGPSPACFRVGLRAYPVVDW